MTDNVGSKDWLFERAMALLSSLMVQHERRPLVTLPPEGASFHEIERAALIAALDRTGWFQNKAAALLKMTPRVMNYKMNRFKLHKENPFQESPQKRAKRTSKSFKNPPPRKAGKDWRTSIEDI